MGKGIWATNNFDEDYDLPKGNEDNYIIFKTDSKSYAYVWSCFESGSKYYPMMYILNADRKLSTSDKQDEIDEAMAVMKKTYDWNKDDRKDFASKMTMMMMTTMTTMTTMMMMMMTMMTN